MASTQDGQYPGDSVIPDAAMVYDRRRLIKGSKEEIFPWLMQLGKARGGWYLTTFWERFLPHTWRAARHIDQAWQNLQPGDIVADYGFGKEETFEVVQVSAPDSLVYISHRLGTSFTWALIVHEMSDDEAEVHLRFRGRLTRESKWQKRLLISAGDFLDKMFTEPMLDGLAERIEKAK